MSLIREMKEEETPMMWISKIVFDAVGFYETQLHKELRMSFDLALQFEKEHLIEAYEAGRMEKENKSGNQYYDYKFREIL